MMTVKKVWCILVLGLSVLPVQGFSLITSRIQGTVKDINTGESIGGATLILLYSNDYTDRFVKRYEWLTEDKGSFRFSSLEKGFYYLCVYKKGYADFGPFYQYEFEEAEKSSIHQSTFTVKKDFHEKEKIVLKEGEVKHVEIKLKREAIVEIRFNRKTMNGIEPLTFEIFPGFTRPQALTNFSADISFINEQNMYISSRSAKKDVGIMIFKSLPPGYKVSVAVYANGYPDKYYPITLEQGKTHIIDHLLDFTTGQVVYGIITDKDTGKPLLGVKISFSKIGIENEQVFFRTDSTGKYWLGGFSPGKYRMYLTRTANGEEIFIPLEIKKNQKIEINRQF